MSRLRARHWLAVTLALGLIVVASRANVNVAVTTTDLAGASASTNGELEFAVRDEEYVMPPVTTDVEEPAAEPPAVTAPLGPVAPLTGLPIDRADMARSALVVKVDNHPRARPQTGLEQADIVFDLRAEGITRFAAVFQSQIPDPVGPVRSSRTSDFDLLRGFDNPLYGSSGGNDHVTNGLRSLPIVELTNRTRNEYFRDFSRPAPHNLYVNGSELYELADKLGPEDLPAPQPWFTYRRSGANLPSTARPTRGPVSIAFTGSPLVTHEWDEGVAGWLRTQDGRPHTTVDGDQLAPENVVIFVTDYSTSPADPISPEVRSTGGGPLTVLTDGHIISGTWSRPTAQDKPILLDELGDLIDLTPGRTWVLMPEEGQVSFVGGQLGGSAVEGTE